MTKDDNILYKNDNEKLVFSYKSKDFMQILYCIAFKYGIVNTYNICGKEKKIPKLNHVKHFICDKCEGYFGITITLKQIECLIKPQKGKFPYTSIVIIETIYNLLKEDRWNGAWKEDFIDYLNSFCKCDIKYEDFLLGAASPIIANQVDKFMNSPYKDIFRCFVDSREKFESVFDDVSMLEHCLKNFPSRFFEQKDIPESMYNYQSQRIYFK